MCYILLYTHTISYYLNIYFIPYQLLKVTCPPSPSRGASAVIITCLQTQSILLFSYYVFLNPEDRRLKPFGFAIHKGSIVSSYV